MKNGSTEMDLNMSWRKMENTSETTTNKGTGNYLYKWKLCFPSNIKIKAIIVLDCKISTKWELIDLIVYNIFFIIKSNWMCLWWQFFSQTSIKKQIRSQTRLNFTIHDECGIPILMVLKYALIFFDIPFKIWRTWSDWLLIN